MLAAQCPLAEIFGVAKILTPLTSSVPFTWGGVKGWGQGVPESMNSLSPAPTRLSLGEWISVHYHSRLHKKAYGVLLSLQAHSCKAARLGVATDPLEKGQKGIFLLPHTTQPSVPWEPSQCGWKNNRLSSSRPGSSGQTNVLKHRLSWSLFILAWAVHSPSA